MKKYKYYVSLGCLGILITLITTVFSIGCASESDKLIKTAEDLYLLGMAENELGNYDDARKAWRDLLSDFPKSERKGEVRRLIAQSYLDDNPKDYHQAYLNFDKLATAEFKDDTKLQAEAMYRTAYCLKELKANDEALGRYTEFMTRFPDSEYVNKAYLDLGDFYSYNKKDYELARFNYKRALESADDSDRKAEIRYKIGGTYYDEGNLEKAIAAYNVILQEYPESKYSHHAKTRIANIHRKENRADEAISVYKDIIENHAESKTVNRTIILDKGIGAGFRMQSNLVVLSYAEIGDAYFGRDNFEKAFESYARIVVEPTAEEKDMRKDAYAPVALSRAMVSLCKLGRKDELETFATTYIQAFGNTNILSGDEVILSAEAQRKFADVLRGELKQYDKAAAEYAKLQDYPPKPYLRLNLIKLRGKYYEGFCYENGTTPDKSVEAYQEATRLFEAIFMPLIDTPNIDIPNITKTQFDYYIRTARYYVGNSYFAINQFEKAIVEFEEFLKKVDPNSEKAKTATDKIEKARSKLGKTGHPKSSSDGSDKSDSSKKSKTAKSLTPEQKLAQRSIESTVLLTMEYSNGKEEPQGTGFFVQSDLIATNYHVIKGAIGGTARLVGGTKMSYAIVGYTAIDPERDLAILKVRAFGAEPLRLGNSDNIHVNNEVYAVGNPLGRPYLEGTVSYGKISAIREDPTGKWIQMTAPITHGNSGAPC